MLNIRFAKKKDVPLILNFIEELALYEKAPEQVTATIQQLEKSLFEDKSAEVIIGEDGALPLPLPSFSIIFRRFSGEPGSRCRMHRSGSG